jgi:hypothetical protein
MLYVLDLVVLGHQLVATLDQLLDLGDLHVVFRSRLVGFVAVE